MDILLQNKSTLRFLDDGSGWTLERSQARIFGNGMEALFFCLNHELADMQILGAFADRRLDFTIPVTDLRHDSYKASYEQ
ncbi:MAG TPA: hypothetical protein VKY92_22975 [Verrucomicrobiae bacterium]|nr:hypothetical protein [Verrucomicrobiae bacterium]